MGAIDLRPDRHRAWRRCSTAFPHALMILVTALALADGRLYEAAAALGTPRGARVPDRHAAGRALRPDHRGVRRLHAGRHRFRHRQGDRRPVQRAGDRRLQAGDRPAELPDGRGGRHSCCWCRRCSPSRSTAWCSAGRWRCCRPAPCRSSQSPARVQATARFALYCLAVGGLIAAVLGVAVWASFITYWPYNLSLTLKNYDFADFEPNGWGPTSLRCRWRRSPPCIGTAIVFAGAYLIEKRKVFRAGRALAHLLAMLPMAVPGLVLGLGYVFFINAPMEPARRALRHLLLLAINSIAHFYTTAHITARHRAEADRHRVRGRVGLAEGAVLAHLRARHGADLHAGDPRHRRLHVRQRADHRVGGDLPLRRLAPSSPRSRSCTWTRPAPPRPPRRWRR